MFGHRSNETSLDEFATAHAEGAVTVDVREPDEYAGGHVPGALNIPLSTLGQQTGTLAAKAADAPVFVICASGNRSKSGAGLLSKAGMDARSVAGGTSGWTRAGHPVTPGTRPR
jgi:rhodanese-related sulfurtransferase